MSAFVAVVPPTPAVTQVAAERAARAVCARSSDAKEAVAVLAMLGLIDAGTERRVVARAENDAFVDVLMELGYARPVAGGDG